MEKSTWKKLAVSIAVGTAFGILLLLAGSLLIAWLINSESVSSDDSENWTFVIQIAACVITCLSAVILAKERKLIVSIAASVFLLFVQLLIGMLFIEGEIMGVAIKLMINLAVGIAIGLLTNKTKKRKVFPMKK